MEPSSDNAVENHPCTSVDTISTIITVAKNGDPGCPWPELKAILRTRIEEVLQDLQKSSPEVPSVPNVEPFVFSELKNKIFSQLDSFTSAPFTIQRVCELLNNPTKHYKRIDKFMRGLEKNLLVVSTVEPGISKKKLEEETTSTLVNGISDGTAVSPLPSVELAEEGIHSMEESVAGDVVAHFPPAKSSDDSLTSSDSSDESVVSSDEADQKETAEIQHPDESTSEATAAVMEQLQALPVNDKVTLSDIPTAEEENLPTIEQVTSLSEYNENVQPELQEVSSMESDVADNVKQVETPVSEIADSLNVEISDVSEGEPSAIESSEPVLQEERGVKRILDEDMDAENVKEKSPRLLSPERSPQSSTDDLPAPIIVIATSDDTITSTDSELVIENQDTATDPSSYSDAVPAEQPIEIDHLNDILAENDQPNNDEPVEASHSAVSCQ